MKIIYRENHYNNYIISLKYNNIYEIYDIEIIHKLLKKRYKIIIFENEKSRLEMIDKYEMIDFLKKSTLKEIIEFYRDNENDFDIKFIEIDMK